MKDEHIETFTLTFIPRLFDTIIIGDTLYKVVVISYDIDCVVYECSEFNIQIKIKELMTH